jgi:hypothetical protein
MILSGLTNTSTDGIYLDVSHFRFWRTFSWEPIKIEKKRENRYTPPGRDISRLVVISNFRNMKARLRFRIRV